MLLDIRHLGERVIRERLTQILDIARDFANVNLFEEPVPISRECTTRWAASRPTWTADGQLPGPVRRG